VLNAILRRNHTLVLIHGGKAISLRTNESLENSLRVHQSSTSRSVLLRQLHQRLGQTLHLASLVTSLSGGTKGRYHDWEFDRLATKLSVELLEELLLLGIEGIDDGLWPEFWWGTVKPPHRDDLVWGCGVHFGSLF